MLEVFEPYDLPREHVLGPIRLAKGAALTTAMASSASNFDGYATANLPANSTWKALHEPFSPPQVRPPGASAPTYPSASIIR